LVTGWRIERKGLEQKETETRKEERQDRESSAQEKRRRKRKMESGVVVKGSLDWEKGPESGKRGEGWRERKGRVRREGNQDVVVAQGPGRGDVSFLDLLKVRERSL